MSSHFSSYQSSDWKKCKITVFYQPIILSLPILTDIQNRQWNNHELKATACFLVGRNDDSTRHKALGLEELNLESRDVQKSIGTEDASTTVLVFGKRLSSRLYMQYIQGVMGDSSDVRLEYKLSPRFAISVDTGTVDSGMNILWSLEKD